MIILGVTGSIGSGKSFACKVLSRYEKVKVMSSDQMIHFIYEHDSEVIGEIEENFPEAIRGDGSVNRQVLGSIVFADEAKKLLLEEIVYPKLAFMRHQFIQRCVKDGVKLAVLDIPLLFENNLQLECDFVLTVHCNKLIQRQRVLRREGMTEDKFEAILKSQMPVSRKLKLTDFSINTGNSKANTVRKIEDMLSDLLV